MVVAQVKEACTSFHNHIILDMSCCGMKNSPPIVLCKRILSTISGQLRDCSLDRENISLVQENWNWAFKLNYWILLYVKSNTHLLKLSTI